MFNPSREQVRQFFTEAWSKHRSASVLTPLETMAVDLMELHPDSHADLENPDAANQDFSVEQGKTNPFLQVSMHLAINDQLPLDQLLGIQAAFQRLRATLAANAS